MICTFAVWIIAEIIHRKFYPRPPKHWKRKPFRLQHHLDADPIASTIAWKKARRLREHKEWDDEFLGIIPQEQLIVWNGKVVPISEADRLYFLEEEERKNNG